MALVSHSSLLFLENYSIFLAGPFGRSLSKIDNALQSKDLPSFRRVASISSSKSDTPGVILNFLD